MKLPGSPSATTLPLTEIGSLAEADEFGDGEAHEGMRRRMLARTWSLGAVQSRLMRTSLENGNAVVVVSLTGTTAAAGTAGAAGAADAGEGEIQSCCTRIRLPVTISCVTPGDLVGAIVVSIAV